MKLPAHYQSLEYRRIEALFRDFARDRAAPLRVLDYGCGKGKYLACFAALGCAVSGVDTNPDYVAEARQRGFEAQLASEFAATTAAPFDVVFLSHLIEHLPPESLSRLIPQLCATLAPDGRLVVVTPTPGERFWHDFTHVRPYLPQSIRHAFGQAGAPISFGEVRMIELVDIYFFRDPYRTRLWRSFYVGSAPAKALVRALNLAFDAAWRLSGGRIGVTASWLGVYRRL